MQAYLKSAMPCLGVQTPALRLVVREALGADPPVDWREALLTLWREAEFREERFAALAVAHRFRSDLTPGDLPLLEELVVTGAWWDHVDSAAKLIGSLLPTVSKDMRRWSRDPDLWKRRVAIICQVGRKDETDLALLANCIEPNLGDREFFIRKAIGWALRDLAWTNPAWVDTYVREHADRLSTLSRREATKHLARLLA
jgi:3-methyladenine DNA glycosylase AlkD